MAPWLLIIRNTAYTANVQSLYGNVPASNEQKWQLLRHTVFGHTGERDLLALGLFWKHVYWSTAWQSPFLSFQSYLWVTATSIHWYCCNSVTSRLSGQHWMHTKWHVRSKLCPNVVISLYEPLFGCFWGSPSLYVFSLKKKSFFVTCFCCLGGGGGGRDIELLTPGMHVWATQVIGSDDS